LKALTDFPRAEILAASELTRGDAMAALKGHPRIVSALFDHYIAKRSEANDFLLPELRVATADMGKRDTNVFISVKRRVGGALVQVPVLLTPVGRGGGAWFC
jgi:hypothetical protein